MKIRTELTAEIDVEFVDTQKVEEFLHGPFKESFFEMDDLKELAQHLAFDFDGTPGRWNSEKGRIEKFVEGFGSFCEGDHHKWRLVDDADLSGTGEILVSYALELEPSDSYEIESS